MTNLTITDSIAEIAAPSPKVTGGVLYAPLGTPLPNDATSPLDAAFVTLGRTSADGIDKTEERKTTDVFDWGGNLVAVLQDSFSIMLKFKLLQLMNADVQSAAHAAANVTVTPATSTNGTEIKSVINAAQLNTGIWVIDAYYEKMSMRFVVPQGRPVSVGPVKWVNKELAMYELTVRPFPDGDNNHAYEYWNDGVTA